MGRLQQKLTIGTRGFRLNSKSLFKCVTIKKPGGSNQAVRVKICKGYVFHTEPVYFTETFVFILRKKRWHCSPLPRIACSLDILPISLPHKTIRILH